MTPSSFVSSYCFFCYKPTSTGKSGRDAKWPQDSSSALCELLYLDPSVFKQKLQNSSYCDSCQETVQDAVMLLRSLASIQKQVSDVRVKIAKKLLQNAGSEAEVAATAEAFNQPPVADTAVPATIGLNYRSGDIHQLFGGEEIIGLPTKANEVPIPTLPIKEAEKIQAETVLLHGERTKDVIIRPENSKTEVDPKNPSTFLSSYCKICDTHFQSARINSHPTTRAHLTALKRFGISVFTPRPLHRKRNHYGRLMMDSEKIVKLRQPYCREKECSNRSPFGSHNLLEEHMRSHQLFKCETCKRDIRGKRQIRIHLRTKEHLENPNPKGHILEVSENT